MNIPKVRIIDLDETVFVLTMRDDGEVEVSGSICDRMAADMLRTIAAQLDAEHPAHSCTPGGAPYERDEAEPLDGRDGELDVDRQVWTDGRGHAWDLSLSWGDCADGAWRWTGLLDAAGTPMMRAVETDERAPLDVVRSLYGPIAPVVGDAA